MRQRVAWALVVPALIVGESAGHSLAYRIVAPNGAQRALLLERTGHAYLSYLHPVIGICAALACAGIAQRALAGFLGRPVRRIPSWRFALLPSAAFLLQEYVERFAYHGHIVWATIAEPAVALGVLLQIPCGLAALLLIRLLLGVAHRAGRLLAARTQPPRRVQRPPAFVWHHRADRPRLVALVRGVAERAPPLPA